MSVKLILKNSKVQFKNATSSQLDNAELAINFHESGPYLQAKGEDGTVHAIGGVYIADSAPSNPLPGRWWYNSSSDSLFLHDGTDWQSIGSSGGGGGGSTIVIGADGIKATTSGDTVTVSVDLAADSNGLSIASGKLKADLATESSAGTVIVGDGLSVDGLGVLSADNESLNPLAGRALSYDAATDPDTLNADIATASALGVVKVGDGIDVDAAGEISVSIPPSETYIGETPPASPAEGDLWWNSSNDSGRLYVYYEDADSSQWVEASPQGDTLTEGDADGLYLSKVTNDTAAGEITFEGQTTHEGGVKVTGGGSAYDVGSGIIYYDPNAELLIVSGGKPGIKVKRDSVTANTYPNASGGAVNTTSIQSIIWSPENDTTPGQHQHTFYSSARNSAADSKFKKVTVYDANNSSIVPLLEDSAGNVGYSFYTDISSAGKANLDLYAFYSEGDAPSYFKGLTEHAGGVKAFNSNIACVGTNSVFVNTSRANAGSETNAFLWRPSGTLGNETSNNYFGFRSNHTTAVSYTCPVQAIHFLADGNAISNISPKNYAFYGAINISTGKENYNFFAAGTASNYFAGHTFIGVDSNLTNVAESPRLAFVGSPEPRIYSTIGSAQGTSIFSVTKEYSQANPSAAYFYKFQKGNGTSPATIVGAIYTDGATTTFQQSPSDYRIKTNIQPITSAANAVKLLNPVNYEFTDRNVGTVYQGFIAHELAEVCSKAVIGTKDAEEAIGTLLDYDGTELETAVTEPDDLTYTEEVEATPYVPAVAATYDEYGEELTAEVPEVEATYTTVTRTRTWTPTGTQPVYQGVDQTKLIPLLTKALQEVLTKNEELEARIAALEGA